MSWMVIRNIMMAAKNIRYFKFRMPNHAAVRAALSGSMQACADMTIKFVPYVKTGISKAGQVIVSDSTGHLGTFQYQQTLKRVIISAGSRMPKDIELFHKVAKACNANWYGSVEKLSGATDLLSISIPTSGLAAVGASEKEGTWQEELYEFSRRQSLIMLGINPDAARPPDA